MWGVWGDFSKTFNTVSHSIFLDKNVHHRARHVHNMMDRQLGKGFRLIELYKME